MKNMLTVLDAVESARIKELQDILNKLYATEEQIKKELRALIYKIEKI